MSPAAALIQGTGLLMALIILVRRYGWEGACAWLAGVLYLAGQELARDAAQTQPPARP